MPDTTFLPDPDFDDEPRKQGNGFKTVAIALSIFTLDALRTTREPSPAQPTP